MFFCSRVGHLLASLCASQQTFSLSAAIVATAPLNVADAALTFWARRKARPAVATRAAPRGRRKRRSQAHSGLRPLVRQIRQKAFPSPSSVRPFAKLTSRAVRKSQVRQCLGRCTAAFWSLLVYESAEQKPKHCLT